MGEMTMTCWNEDCDEYGFEVYYEEGDDATCPSCGQVRIIGEEEIDSNDGWLND